MTDAELFYTEPAAKTEALLGDVAVPIPVEGPFTYLIPESLAAKARAGMRVRVPFKNQEMTGYLVEVRTGPVQGRLKSIQALLDDEPVLTPVVLQLTRWTSEEYGSSWGEAIENALPRWVKTSSAAARAHAPKETESLTEPEEIQVPGPRELTAEQKNVFRMITESLAEPSPKPILIHGVTGSGKSELYIRSMREVLARGRSAICLVPEIALTEQLRRFFQGHFGDRLEILHSRLTDAERFRAWLKIHKGEKTVILGPRSAVFAPVQNLGLIVLDEEHEGSYKQDTAPRYHVREVAARRAQLEKALLIMGTATPSLESMEKAQSGNFKLAVLEKRVDDRKMPAVQIVDLRTERFERKKASLWSRLLEKEIQANLDRKEGTLLLLNRRGFSTHIQCPACGGTEKCEACQVSLTYHQEDGELLCHYCNFHKKMPEVCPGCGSGLLNLAGYGTEKVESELARRWPQARILRLDADSVRKRGSHEEILKIFRRGDADILIGTQMIAKGFDFPHVTLVGVIAADIGLMLPDFRSAERTFQLLTQVAGRAGRGDKPGRVIIQTYSPEHPSIRFARGHDFTAFYASEIPARADYHYPPFYRLVNFIIRGHDEQKAYRHAREVREALQAGLQNQVDGGGTAPFELIGPAPLPFFKLRGHFRWHVMVKFPRDVQAPAGLWKTALRLRKSSAVFSAVDVDPVSIL